MEVSGIERRFHGNLPRHDGPERLTRTNVDSTSFCYVCFLCLYLLTLYSIIDYMAAHIFIYVYMLDLLLF